MSKNPQITRILGELKAFSADVMVELTLEVQSNLKERTPVDLGWARANWVPNIGQPYRGVTGPEPKSEEETPSLAVQVAKEAEIAGSYRLEDGAIYISNNVPYIQALNAGHSPQAPAGFVEEEIEKAVRTVLMRPNQ